MEAAIYARRSALDERLGRSVSEQEQAAREQCARENWSVHDVYVDDGRSASRFATKSRDHWLRLSVDLTAGRFQVLVLWETDRGSRELEDWAGMLNACRRNRVLIHVLTHHRTYDPRVGRDWRQLAEDGVDAAYSSEKQSVNLKRAFAAKAERGEPHGFTAYGFKRQITHDDRGRRLGAVDVVDEAAAAVIRRATVQVISGESLRSICQALNLAGTPAPRGGAWNSAILRQILRRPRNAGLQVHHGEVIGRGAWDALITEDMHTQIRAILDDPARRTTRGAPTRNLLSGIAQCGCCDATLRVLVAHGQSKRAYVCQKCFKVRRNQDRLDKLIVELVTRRLAMPDALAALSEGDTDTRPYVAEMKVLQARLETAADDYAEGIFTKAQVVRINAKLLPKIEALDAKIKATVAKPELTDLATTDIANRWVEVPLERQREVIKALLTVHVFPAKKKGRAALDPTDLSITWLRGEET